MAVWHHNDVANTCTTEAFTIVVACTIALSNPHHVVFHAMIFPRCRPTNVSAFIISYPIYYTTPFHVDRVSQCKDQAINECDIKSIGVGQNLCSKQTWDHA